MSDYLNQKAGDAEYHAIHDHNPNVGHECNMYAEMNDLRQKLHDSQQRIQKTLTAIDEYLRLAKSDLNVGFKMVSIHALIHTISNLRKILQ